MGRRAAGLGPSDRSIRPDMIGTVCLARRLSQMESSYSLRSLEPQRAERVPKTPPRGAGFIRIFEEPVARLFSDEQSSV